jgi:hypothetical protein
VTRDPNRQARTEIFIEKAMTVRTKVKFKPGFDRMETREVLSTSTLGTLTSQFVVAGQPSYVYSTMYGFATPSTPTSNGTHAKLIPGSPLPEFHLNPNNPILRSVSTFPTGTHVKLIPGSPLPEFNFNPNNPMLH